MPVQLRLFSLMVMLMISSAASFSAETPRQLSALYEATYGQFGICSMSFSLARYGATTDNADYRGCISKSRDIAGRELKKALAAYASRPSIVKSIKTYYAAWVAAMMGIEPSGDEMKITYTSRQSQTEQRLNELWAMVEIEAGL